MTKTGKLSLIAAATFVSALCLPRSTSAQGVDQVFGGWTGVVSYETTVRDMFDPTKVDTYSGSGPGGFTIFSINGNYFEMDLGGVPYIPNDTIRVPGNLAPLGASFPPGAPPGFNYTDVFGPTSATGELLPTEGPSGQSFGNFALTYESFGDGHIDVGNGTALVDLTYIDYGYVDPGYITVTLATFQSSVSVPEPSSIVHVAMAVLVFAVVAWLRGFRSSATMGGPAVVTDA